MPWQALVVVVVKGKMRRWTSREDERDCATAFGPAAGDVSFCAASTVNGRKQREEAWLCILSNAGIMRWLGT